MNIFYAPGILNEDYILPQEESNHCIRALRLRMGELIYLIDGKGGFYRAEIIEADPSKTGFKILESQYNYHQRKYYLQVCISPVKNNSRFEWFVEKATEIGVDEIIPVYCERTERSRLNTERLNKIAVSAAKQSINPCVPSIGNIKNFSEHIIKPFRGIRFIAHCDTQRNRSALKDLKPDQNRIQVFIGPEGDFTEQEISQARKQNLHELSLGTNRLRTETAGLAVCFNLNLLFLD